MVWSSIRTPNTFCDAARTPDFNIIMRWNDMDKKEMLEILKE